MRRGVVNSQTGHVMRSVALGFETLKYKEKIDISLGERRLTALASPFHRHNTLGGRVKKCHSWGMRFLVTDACRGVSVIPHHGYIYSRFRPSGSRWASAHGTNGFVQWAIPKQQHDVPGNEPLPTQTTVTPNDSLSWEQKNAVEAPLKATRVVAGPGSGKTKVLIGRIVHLVKTCGVDPGSILAITFTNKAADELKRRLSRELPYSVTKKISAGTFHSVCYRMLRENMKVFPARGRRTGDWAVFDQDSSLALLKQVILKDYSKKDMDAKDVRDFAAKLQSQISSIKNWKGYCALEDVDNVVEEYCNLIGIVNKDEIAHRSWWMKEYEKALLEANAVDFDHLVGMTVYLLNTDAQLLEQVRARFRHILVDEFQDTNGPQYELIRILGVRDPVERPNNPKFHKSHVFVVGDPDQSIYGWRGANVSNMRDQFVKDFFDSTEFILRDNYRSTGSILAAAQSVIRGTGSGRVDLLSKKGDGALVELHESDDAFQEAKLIADEISTDLSLQTESIAILLRTHVQSRFFESALVCCT